MRPRPLAVLTVALCAACANDRSRARDQGVSAYGVNYEDRNLFCDNCGAHIEAAYVDVNEPDPDEEDDEVEEVD